jgi:hypothetical protein
MKVTFTTHTDQHHSTCSSGPLLLHLSRKHGAGDGWHLVGCLTACQVVCGFEMVYVRKYEMVYVGNHETRGLLTHMT